MAEFVFVFCLIINLIGFVKSETTCIESSTRVSEKSTFYHRPKYCTGELIFADEFTVFDPKKWEIIHDLNDYQNLLVGFQKYADSRENSYIQDGVLFIRPTVVTKYTLPLVTPYDVVHSGHLHSADSMVFKYGRLDIRAKLPTGDWLWPGLWLAPADTEAYGEWPRSGEIDIMQSRGNRKLIVKGINVGVNEMGTTLHFGPNVKNDGWRNAHFKIVRSNLNTEFHNFTMIWTPDGFEFYLDQVLYASVFPKSGGFWNLGQFASKTNLNNPWQNQSVIAPFNDYFYINMNVAVGGVSRFFPDDAINFKYKKPWEDIPIARNQSLNNFLNKKHLWLPTWPNMSQNGEDSAMQIDYIRLYAL